MNKTELLNVLEQLQLPYEIVEHPAIYTMEEMRALGLEKEELVAKNLFIRDDKKRNYYLFTVHDGMQVNLQELREKLQSRRLTFASEEDLMKYLGLEKGGVSPMGLLNDQDHVVQFYLDPVFKDTEIGMHPMVNTASIWLKTADLIKLLEHYNIPVHWL